MSKIKRARPRPHLRRRRRSQDDLWRLAKRLAETCAKKTSGVGARSLGKTMRAEPRTLAPALRLGLSAGLLRRAGSGRAALYFSTQTASSSDPLDALAQKTGKGIGQLARLLGVDRRTFSRWRRGAFIPEFHKLRIEALLRMKR